MSHPSLICPDEELRDHLQNQIVVQLADGSTKPVKVYSDWERPTNGLDDDFIVIFINGDVEGISKGSSYAQGYIVLSLYCTLNDDGSVKFNRIQNILRQFDAMFDGLTLENYYFEYDTPRLFTPTSPNQSSGYSTTALNLRWHTTNNFNKS